MKDPAALITLDLEVYKAKLQLISETTVGEIRPDQLQQLIEECNEAIPLAAPLWGALIQGNTRIRKWNELHVDERSRPARLARFLKDMEVVNRLQGALAVVLAAAEILLVGSATEIEEDLKKVPVSPPEEVVEGRRGRASCRGTKIVQDPDFTKVMPKNPVIFKKTKKTKKIKTKKKVKKMKKDK
jgi:hypothetical protein